MEVSEGGLTVEVPEERHGASEGSGPEPVVALDTTPTRTNGRTLDNAMGGDGRHH